MKHKDEPIDVPLVDDDQNFDMKFNGDEFESKDESIMDGNMGKDLGYQDFTADEKIDNGEEEEETIDTVTNTRP
ncbi:hypothetical protein PMAYCL1PPCAC_08313, partial [Pristionchus mayeri]